MNQKFKGWLGVALMAWPVLRMIALGFGLPLPDLNIDGWSDILSGVSSATGGTMLASSQAIVGKESHKV